MSEHSDYDNELVTRSAPRWAWEVIDETLDMDSRSSAFAPELRTQIQEALEAMVNASEADVE